MCKILSDRQNRSILRRAFFFISIFLLFLICRIDEVNIAYSVLQSDIFILIISCIFCCFIDIILLILCLWGQFSVFLLSLFHIFIIRLSLGLSFFRSLLFLDFFLVHLLFIAFNWERLRNGLSLRVCLLVESACASLFRARALQYDLFLALNRLHYCLFGLWNLLVGLTTNTLYQALGRHLLWQQLVEFWGSSRIGDAM